MIHPSQFLRRALLADAVFSGIAAVLLTADAGALAIAARPSGGPVARDRPVPDCLYRTGRLARTRARLPKALVMIVIAGNAAWTVASFALLFLGRGDAETCSARSWSRQQAIATAPSPSCNISAFAEAAARWRRFEPHLLIRRSRDRRGSSAAVLRLRSTSQQGRAPSVWRLNRSPTASMTPCPLAMPSSRLEAMRPARSTKCAAARSGQISFAVCSNSASQRSKCSASTGNGICLTIGVP